jgi:hypothetical protein
MLPRLAESLSALALELGRREAWVLPAVNDFEGAVIAPAHVGNVAFGPEAPEFGDRTCGAKDFSRVEVRQRQQTSNGVAITPIPSLACR